MKTGRGIGFQVVVCGQNELGWPLGSDGRRPHGWERSEGVFPADSALLRRACG